jgi:hypothetical protein
MQPENRTRRHTSTSDPDRRTATSIARVSRLTRRSAMLAAIASALVPALARAVELKPGDVVFGTSSNSAGGAGKLYVYDPVANTVTPISGTYGNGVGGLAIDNNFNLIVGTRSSGAGAGRIYTVNPGTGSAVELGSGGYSNSISGLAYNPSNGTLYVGTQSNAGTGTGRLFSVNPVSGIATPVGSNTFTNGVTAVEYDIANGRVLMGTGVNTTIGVGRLYSVNLGTNAYTQVGTQTFENVVHDIAISRTGATVVGQGSNNVLGSGSLYSLSGNAASVLGTTNGYLGGVGAVDYDFDGNIYAGTYSLNAGGAGGLYSVNPTTGVAMRRVPTNFSADIFNGITSIAVVPPQIDFVGGNNVTISSAPTTGAMFVQTSPVDGTIGHFSNGTSQNLNVAALLSSLNQPGSPGASVRTGTGLPNSQQGDLTLDVAIDYNDITPARQLTLRGADDVIINQPISDGTPASVDSINVSLFARNARRTVLPPGNTGATGLVDLNAPINLTSGNFYTSGIAFDNAATGATVTTTGNVTLQHTGSVVISNPFIVGTNVAVAAGDFSNTAAGVVSANANGTNPIATFTVVATAGTVEGVAYAGSVTLNGMIYAGAFTSRGVNFTNNVPQNTTVGALALDHTGVVTVNRNLRAATALTIGSGSFSNPTGTLVSGNGLLTLNATGAASLIQSLTSNGGGVSISVGSIQTTASTGTISSAGDITLASTGSADFNANVTGSGAFSASGGTTFDTTGITVQVPGPFTVGSYAGAVTLGTTSAAGAVDVSSTGESIEAGPITTSSSINLSAPGNSGASTGVRLLGAVSASGNLTVNTPSGLFYVDNAVNLNGSSLVVQSSTDVFTTANGVIGGTPGSSTIASASVVAANSATFEGAIALRNSLSLDVGTDVNIRGNVDLTSGDVNINRGLAGNVGAGSGTVTIAATVTQSGSVFNATSSNFTVTGSGSISTNAAMDLLIANATTIDGSVSTGPLTIGTSTLATSAPIQTAGSFSLTTGGSANINANVTVSSGGDFIATGGSTFTTNAATLDVTGSATIRNYSGNVDLGTTITGGALSVTSTGGSFTAGNSTVGTSLTLNVPVNSSVSTTLNGRNTADSLDSTGSDFTANGTVTIDAGNVLLDHTGAVAINNTFGVTAGGLEIGLVDSHGSPNRPSQFSNSGAVGVSGLTKLDIAGPVTIGANFTTGSLDSDNDSTFVLNNGVTLTSGSTTVDALGDVTLDGTSNVGPITVTAPSLYTNRNLASSGVVTASGNVQLNIPGAIDLQGNLTSTGGYVRNSNSVAFDSVGVVVDANADINLLVSSAITTGRLAAGTTLALTSNGAGGIDINETGAGSIAGSNVTITNNAGGAFDGRTAPLTSTNGFVRISNLPAASAGVVRTSAVNAQTELTIAGNTITADGLLSTDAGPINLTATVNGSDITASAGIAATGGSLTVRANVSDGQLLNTEGGAVSATGNVDVLVTDPITTDAVTSGGWMWLRTNNQDAIATNNLQAGNAINPSTSTALSITGNSLLVDGTVLSGNSATITANDGPVDLIGSVTLTAGNFVSGGAGATTFDNTGANTLDVFGSTTITVNGDVTVNNVRTGTTLNVTSAGGLYRAEGTTQVGSTQTISAPAGIETDGTVNGGGTMTLTASSGLIDVNANVTLTAGNLVATSVDFDNTGGNIALPGNATFNQSGSILLANDVTLSGTGSTVSFSQNPTLTIDSAAVRAAAGTVNFSGGVNAVAQNESTIRSQTGFVGAGTGQVGNLYLDGGDPLVNANETVWRNTGNLYVGGTATSGAGTGSIIVGQNACLQVDGTLKVWAGDSITLVDGCVEFSNLDMDNNQGIFNWLSGEVQDLDNLIISPLQPIARVLAVGSGVTQTLRVMSDRHLRVIGNTNLQTTLYLDGGAFSTGTLQNGQRLNFVSGDFSLTNNDFYVTPTTGTAGRGTLGNRTLTVVEGQRIFVTGTGRKMYVDAGALLQLRGGEFNAVNGLVNSGTIALQSTSGRIYGASLTNNSGGLIFGTGQIDPTITNSGELRASFTEVAKFVGPMGTNTQAGVVRLINGGTMEFPRGLQNYGQILGDGTLVFGEVSYNPAGPLPLINRFSGPGLYHNGTDGVLSFFGENPTVNFSAKTDIYGDVVLTRADSILVSSGGATTTFYGDVFQIAGELRAGENSTIVYFGTVKGNINQQGLGSHVIEGLLDPGFSPGHGSFENLTLAGGGERLLVELGGANPAQANDHGPGFYDTLHAGNLTLAADASNPIGINVVLWGDFLPQPGEQFTVLTYDQLQTLGGASALDVLSLTLPQGYDWTTSLTSTGLTIAVVPEPMSLMTFGAAAVLTLRRRRANPID